MLVGYEQTRKRDHRDQVLYAAIIHVAADRGCARAVHVAIHVAAENNTFNNGSNCSSNKNHRFDYLEKLRLNQLVSMKAPGRDLS